MSTKKKPRIGRPRIAKKLHKASLLSVRFSADERKALERTANGKLSTWARGVLLAAAGVSPASAPLPEPEPESLSAQP